MSNEAPLRKTLEDYVGQARSTVDEVLPGEAARLIEQGDWVVLDVREPDEFAQGHLPRAINIPRGFLEVKADPEHHKRDTRLQDRTQKLLCYCGGGIRSLLAAETLLEMGFANAVSMAEGWEGWVERDLPVER